MWCKMDVKEPYHYFAPCETTSILTVEGINATNDLLKNKSHVFPRSLRKVFSHPESGFSLWMIIDQKFNMIRVCACRYVDGY
jgi:hypothetical protein